MTQREEFEAAYCKHYPFASSQPNKFELDLDEYTDTTVNVAWSMWNESRVVENERCATACLDRHANGNYKFDTRDECATAIRALIGKEST